LTDIFGVSYNDEHREGKVEDIVKVLKYNAIVQNLAPVAADNYKQTESATAWLLQQMNRILGIGSSVRKSLQTHLMELFDELRCRDYAMMN
jgi:lipoate-protein ligase B